jgi:hypothetical protein
MVPGGNRVSGGVRFVACLGEASRVVDGVCW